MKDVRHKRLHTLSFHPYEIQEQAKLTVIEVRVEVTSGWRILTEKGHRKTFWGLDIYFIMIWVVAT